ncbi:MAG: antitoxin [Chloroflexi bacterium RBG_16_56_8]|nr:MAG: antitoxin [Chloroflexi bacterium RBG_16_56_8]
MNWKNFVTIDPQIHHGEPCIKGTRVPVAMIVGSIADGMTIEEVVNEYPQITPEAVRAALAYAKVP